MNDEIIEAAKQAKDYTQQIAPLEGDGPDVNTLSKAFRNTVRDCQSYADQCRLNYETRFAVWDGQSDDGKKHSRDRESGEVLPWDGASDLRVYLTDRAIKFKVAQACTAYRRGNLVAVPIHGNDNARAKVVSNFMRWLMHTQIEDIDREVELTAQYVFEKGAAVTGQFWETRQHKKLERIRLEDFAQQNPEVDILALLTNPDSRAALVEQTVQTLGVSKRRAKAMLKELQETGETAVEQPGRVVSRPVIRAFNLDEDIFIPPWATDIEVAPYIFRCQYYTAEQLRAFVQSDGWDEEWVEAAIAKLKGRLISQLPTQHSLMPISRNFIYRYQHYTDLIGVVYAYQRLTDPDTGLTGTYITIFNPDLAPDHEQDGYAKFQLMEYAHGAYPFVLHRREFLSRRLHDTRGIPEEGKPAQDQVKAHKDSRIDAASLGVLPPLLYPLGRPPSRWGPGARIPERRAGEYHYADQPKHDANTTESEDRITDDFKDQFGIRTKDGDPVVPAILNQFETEKWLSGWVKVYRQVWSLWQQYGEDEVYFRVVGLHRSDPTLMQKGDPAEEYQFYLSFDVQSADPEIMNNRAEQVAKIVATADRYGQVDYSELLQWMLESIDPQIAERIVLPKEQAAEKAVEEEQEACSQIFAGFEKDIKIGASPEIGMSVIQNWMAAPDVAARYGQDEVFRDRVDKRIQQYQFQVQQRENARIGRLGA
jgi:hypothetical protein